MGEMLGRGRKAGKRKGSRYSGRMEEAKKEGRLQLWDPRREKRGNDGNRKDKKEEVWGFLHIHLEKSFKNEKCLERGEHLDEPSVSHIQSDFLLPL